MATAIGNPADPSGSGTANGYTNTFPEFPNAFTAITTNTGAGSAAV